MKKKLKVGDMVIIVNIPGIIKSRDIGKPAIITEISYFRSDPYSYTIKTVEGSLYFVGENDIITIPNVSKDVSDKIIDLLQI